jgi:hypothetical protein
MSDLTLGQVQEALTTVLGEFGPQQLTDGVHGHLSWLLDLVNACVEDEV